MTSRVANELSADEVACLKYAAGSRCGSAIGTNWFQIPLQRVEALGTPARGTAKARRVLQGLERKGLMRSVEAATNGRRYWWLITDAGRAAI